MEQAYAATSAQLRVLRNPPKKNHCLTQMELENLKNLTGFIVFIWLTNGYGFWYHIKSDNGCQLIGYILEGTQWKYLTVDMQFIYSYF